MGSADHPVVLPARYEPQRHLADGGMASVWVARDTLLARDVAVKILSPALAADDAARARFTREARAAARLSGNPHVVTVYDAGEHDGQAFLVMELYTGGTVAERLHGELPDHPTALRWLREAADGLDAAHAAGVVHRDVKPGNLLLDARDRLAVADFGIATAAWAASVTQAGLVVGTAAYLAPEQLAGGLATAAGDRFALGVVAHQLLTGARPSDGRLDVSLAPQVRTVLERAMAADPEDRHGSARALVADLERALTPDEERTAVVRAREPRTAAMAAPLEDPNPTPAVTAATAGPVIPRTPTPARSPTPARTAPPAPGPDTPRPARRPAARVLVPLALVVLVVGVATALVAGGGDEPGSQRAGTTAERTASTAAAAEATAEPTAEPTATPTPAPTPEATPSAESPAPSPIDDPRALNDAGFALFGDGRYAEALPLLERALAGLEATPDDDYYAYALYNLGATLRRLGRPAEAIPYLERRLEVSGFKRGVVRQELEAARRDAGMGAESPPRAGPFDDED